MGTDVGAYPYVSDRAMGLADQQAVLNDYSARIVLHGARLRQLDERAVLINRLNLARLLASKAAEAHHEAQKEVADIKYEIELLDRELARSSYGPRPEWGIGV